MRVASLAAALVGCAYSPGSYTHFRQSFPGQRTTVGCIDLAIERRPDVNAGAAVLAYEFGNRCDHPATIDLARTRVLAQTYSGERIELRPYDPNGEIRTLKIDGRGAGAEAIAYFADEAIAQVCVNAATVAQLTEDRWLCFSRDLPPPPSSVAEVSP